MIRNALFALPLFILTLLANIAQERQWWKTMIIAGIGSGLAGAYWLVASWDHVNEVGHNLGIICFLTLIGLCGIGVKNAYLNAIDQRKSRKNQPKN